LDLIIVSMGIGWLTCIPAVLLPHSPCSSTTANAPAIRQMPIASVVTCKPTKKDDSAIRQVISKETNHITGEINPKL